MKTCSRCKIEKSLDQFNKDSSRKDGLTFHCKTCVNFYSLKSRIYLDPEYRKAQSKKYKDENPQKIRAQWIKQIYKLSWEDYEKIFYSQDGVCKICNTPLKLHKGIEHGFEVAVVDHCHSTGKVRGLLCTKCNTALGLLKDSVSILKNAQNYLETNHEH